MRIRIALRKCILGLFKEQLDYKYSWLNIIFINKTSAQIDLAQLLRS